MVKKIWDDLVILIVEFQISERVYELVVSNYYFIVLLDMIEDVEFTLSVFKSLEFSII